VEPKVTENSFEVSIRDRNLRTKTTSESIQLVVYRVRLQGLEGDPTRRKLVMPKGKQDARPAGLREGSDGSHSSESAKSRDCSGTLAEPPGELEEKVRLLELDRCRRLASHDNRLIVLPSLRQPIS
jgi:hypothetical protein